MYNLRYHIASLVGVFLALALGLVLGGLVVQRGAIEQQQGALVEGLQKEFSILRTENRDLTTRNQMLSAYTGRVTDGWAAGRLKGRLIVVLTNAGRESGAPEAAAAIESAGGRVGSAVILKPGLGLEDQAVQAKIGSLIPAGDDLLASVAASLAAEWSAPATTRPLTDALIEAQVLRIEGFEQGTMVTGLVDVATADGKADPAGIAVAAAFGMSGSAVGAQTTTSDAGVATAARAAGLSAFNTLGTDVGRYTVIALMTGAAPGYYGTGQGADALFPNE